MLRPPLPSVVISTDKLVKNLQHINNILKNTGAELIVVTKVYGGFLPILRVFIESGISEYADAHIQNISALKSLAPRVNCRLIRTPALSLIPLLYPNVDSSFVADIDSATYVAKLFAERGLQHNLVIVVDMGDNREGIHEDNLWPFFTQLRGLNGVKISGIASTFGCNTLTAPSHGTIARILQYRNLLKSYPECSNLILSLGGSAVLGLFMKDYFPLGISEIRIGEAIALGTDGIGNRIVGTFDDVFILMAEVIEFRTGPRSSFRFRDSSVRALIGIGYQDVDVNELSPLEPNVRIVGSTSDHTILEAKSLDILGKVGNIVRFLPSYRALVRLNTSPYIYKHLV